MYRQMNGTIAIFSFILHINVQIISIDFIQVFYVSHVSYELEIRIYFFRILSILLSMTHI